MPRPSESDCSRLDAELRYVLSLINEWLRFGETKNAALLAANLSLAVAALRLDSTSLPAVIGGWAPWSAALLLTSALVGLVAFAPRTVIPRFFLQASDDERNVLFFGHAAECSPAGYLAQLRTALGATRARTLPIHEQFAQQIVTNAQIAALKHRVFGYAMWVTVAALITPVGAFLIYLIGTQLRSKT